MNRTNKEKSAKKRSLSNNVLIALIIIFALITLIGNLTRYKGTSSNITGLVVDTRTTTISFCILPTTFQGIASIFPRGSELLNGTVTLNSTVEGQDTDILVKFYYVLSDPLYTSTTSTLIGNDSYDNNIYYNISWNTSAVADGNYLYRINFTAMNLTVDCSVESNNLTGYFTVDNVFVEPNWTNFYYNMTTNFSLLTRWSNIADVIISNPNITINYSGQSINLDSYSLDNNFVTPRGNISFNVTACPLCINRTMYITIHNLTLTTPKILKDGVECTDYCEFISYVGGNFTFRVSGISSTFAAGENGTYIRTFDQTDPEAGSGQSFERGFVNFYANFSYATNNTPISNVSGAYCSIRFNLTGSYGAYANMSYNATSTVYSYTQFISNYGTYDWQVLCNANSIKLGINNVTDSITVIKLVENLTISEETDSIVKYVHDRIVFYANYSDTSAYSTNRSRPLAGNGIYCEISFAYNLTGISGFTNIVYNETGVSWTAPINMTYNSGSYLYEYNRTFDYAGTVGSTPFYGLHLWNVSCHDNTKGFLNLTDQSQVKITNIAPALTSNIPDITMTEDTVYYLDRLSNYFSDADSDTISYSNTDVLNIDVTIDSNSIVKIQPNPNFFGSRQAIFYADDIYGARGESNTVNITVTDVSEAEPVPGIPVSGTDKPSDTGGGTGSDDPGQIYPTCISNWTCTDWSPCLITNITIRSCTDLKHCGYTYKPDMNMDCIYIPTCDDLLKNQEETGVDCGGPCEPCPTCSDGILNQNELDIDCSGPCRPCPSCNDGLKNHNETGVDCGGPCAACKVFEKPGEFIDKGGLIGVTTQFIKNKTLNTIEFFNKSLILSLLLILVILVLVITSAEIKYKFIKKKIDKKLHEFKEARKEKQKSAAKKLDELKEMYKAKDASELLDNLYTIVSEMFSEHFKVKLNVSTGELNNILDDNRFDDKVKLRISEYYKEIDNARFNKNKVDKPKVKRLINESENINRLIIDKTTELSAKFDKLNEHINNIDKAISKHDQPMINKYYNKILRSYNDITTEQKREIVSEMNKLHIKIKSLSDKEA